MVFKKWEPDKWKHFFVGIVLGAFLQIASAYLLGAYPLMSILAVLIALIVICYGFELFSLLTGKGHYELMDAIAGILGGLAGMGIVFLF